MYKNAAVIAKKIHKIRQNDEKYKKYKNIIPFYKKIGYNNRGGFYT